MGSLLPNKSLTDCDSPFEFNCSSLVQGFYRQPSIAYNSLASGCRNLPGVTEYPRSSQHSISTLRWRRLCEEPLLTEDQMSYEDHKIRWLLRLKHATRTLYATLVPTEVAARLNAERSTPNRAQERRVVVVLDRSWVQAIPSIQTEFQ